MSLIKSTAIKIIFSTLSVIKDRDTSSRFQEQSTFSNQRDSAFAAVKQALDQHRLLRVIFVIDAVRKKISL
ncbi:hypothetical protein CTZ24_25250 (plasmid) [Pantoea phytobeneficialis]|uniref:Uncharacterized protein n=1 Tax=Pantoea phytobeneficialis TaxID=2052056 RepID=A0AAP9HB37_9GAMM|nr:hypothetical protein CTZ24_25250 [Pantoea phytobeneficialis]